MEFVHLNALRNEKFLQSLDSQDTIGFVSVKPNIKVIIEKVSTFQILTEIRIKKPHSLKCNRCLFGILLT